MTYLGFACLAFAFAAMGVQLASVGLALPACRRSRQRCPPPHRPAVTVVRPLCGVETFSQQTLGSTFGISYPDYEILFCVHDAADPIVPLVRELIAAHPGSDARLLVGEEVVSSNPKLNNMSKGFRQSRYEHIVFVDSNVFLPPDYLDQLAAAMQAGAGMVTAPPVGHLPQGFWAELECAFLNSYQARMQYAVAALGLGFAQGKTLFFRRADLDNGGFAQLGLEAAEDAAATRMMHAKGLRIALAGPFPQLIGLRTASQVWKRQVRWARLRRASFPFHFAPELLAGALPPLLALLCGLAALDVPSAHAALAYLSLWYGAELLLLRSAGWPRSLSALLTRDIMLPAIFVAGCIGSRFEWHGKQMTAASGTGLQRRLAPVHPRLIWAKLAARFG